MVRSISCGLRPRPTDSEPWGSKSTSSTLRPYSASEAPRLIVVVVLPTPPFWLHIEITRAWPCSVTGRGSGRSGIGRPVGPSLASAGGRSKGRASATWSSRGSGASGEGGTGVRTTGGIVPATLPPGAEVGTPPNVPPAFIERSLIHMSTRRLVVDSRATLGAPHDSDKPKRETPSPMAKSVDGLCTAPPAVAQATPCLCTALWRTDQSVAVLRGTAWT